MSCCNPGYVTFTIPSGAGKSGHEVPRFLSIPLVEPGFEEFGPADPRRFLVEITRTELEKRDFLQVAAMFTPTNTSEALRRICGRVVFAVGGYDGDPREIYEINVVRRFFSALHAASPIWLFAGALDGPALFAVVLSIAPNARVIRQGGGSSIEVHVPAEWLRQFFGDSLKAAAVLHHWAGISAHEGAYLINRAAAYFGVL